jgi:hypothetical protein
MFGQNSQIQTKCYSVKECTVQLNTAFADFGRDEIEPGYYSLAVGD